MTYAGPSKFELHIALIARLVREMISIAGTVVSVIYVSRKDRRLADQFVNDYLASCDPFDRALIENDPKHLELNIHFTLGTLNFPDSKRDVLWTLKHAKRERDIKPDDDYGLMQRLFLRFYSRMQAIHVWALKRKVVKLYADAKLKSTG